MEIVDRPLISVVVPVFNSGHRIANVCSELRTALTGIEHEIILVADGCIDNSWEEIVKLCAAVHSIKGIRLARNSGQHHALLCGLNASRGAWCVTFDDDLQYDPADIPVLLKKAQSENMDLVYGMYIQRNHSRIRQWGSNLVSWLLHKYAGGAEKGSSFKLIRRDLVLQISHYRHPFVFLDQLLGWFSAGTAYCEVNHRLRTDGHSGYSLSGLMVMTFHLLVTYTVLPLRMMIWFGFISFMICLALVSYFVYNKLVHGSTLGFTALIVSIFMTSGLIMFSLGVIGEYLGRVIQWQYQKPGYVIAEKAGLP
jgi:glycosyltransferase involved in cell wall biosynthesis